MSKSPLFAVALFVLASACPAWAQAQDPLAWSADLGAIRRAGVSIPGASPVRINVVKIAESRRTKNFAVKGAPNEPSVQARTAYQVVYPGGSIMIDAGMDIPVHRFFGRGVEEPYFPDQAELLERALRAARAIVLTHEHGDHVGGIIRSSYFNVLAPKTRLTRTQMQVLMTEPQMPEIMLTPEMARQFMVIDYENYFPVAPGMVLIKAAGHTPGSQMVFVRLQSGREFVFAGDAAWHMDGIRQVRGKDASWIQEDEAAITAQLRWLNTISRLGTNRVFVVASHDEDQRRQLINQRILGAELEVQRTEIAPPSPELPEKSRRF
jgi:glyoxylase-like metal-dependent hydrolase (beta-lactamase superfamily II)